MRYQDAKRHRIEGTVPMARPIKGTTVRARELRRNLTEAEQKLWWYLRMRQLGGVKFRRQEPVGRYVVDFCSFDPKLIIELDGGQHSEPRKYEAERTRELERKGYRILRFWNNEVLENIEGVFVTIAAEIDRLCGAKRK